MFLMPNGDANWRRRRSWITLAGHYKCGRKRRTSAGTPKRILLHSNSHDASDRIHSPAKLSATDQTSAASLQLLIVSDILRHRVCCVAAQDRQYLSFAGQPPTGFIEESTPQGAIESGQTTQKPSEKQVSKEQEKRRDEGKYWVSERSLAEFSRSFSFPHAINRDQVQASLKSGILSIVVPKAKEQERRKTTIS